MIHNQLNSQSKSIQKVWEVLGNNNLIDNTVTIGLYTKETVDIVAQYMSDEMLKYVVEATWDDNAHWAYVEEFRDACKDELFDRKFLGVVKKELAYE